MVESFSPDFYLPELDIYVELTTLKQSLVRRKNRKLRRLRELYPDIRIKLFYGKDFRALLLKYGRFDLAASLSGLEGQVSRPVPTAGRRRVVAPCSDHDAEGSDAARRSRLRRLTAAGSAAEQARRRVSSGLTSPAARVERRAAATSGRLS